MASVPFPGFMGCNHPSELRLAMWCGPRNISTALMRAWGNRPDTFVVDEPLYAHYLRETSLPHAMAGEIIERYEADWEKVAAWLTGPIPGGRTIFYQKQMCHHMLAGIGRDWLGQVTNCFLIREPREMLTSLMKKLPSPTLTDTALPQQLELFNHVRESTGDVPPVIDSTEVLRDPRGMLSALCDRLGVAFTEAMLEWPPGIRESDGIWAEHWYPEVETTTGWRAYKPKDDPVPDSLSGVLEQCNEIYGQLYPHRLTA